MIHKVSSVPALKLRSKSRLALHPQLTQWLLSRADHHAVWELLCGPVLIITATMANAASAAAPVRPAVVSSAQFREQCS